MDWPMQAAQRHLRRLTERARAEGPQIVTRHGRQEAVVLSVEAYRRLTAGRSDFRAHLLGGPKVDDFEIPRDSDNGRDVTF